MEITYHPTLQEYWNRVKDTPKEPLAIRCYTYKAIAGQSPPHLDGILANAVCKALELGWINVPNGKALFVPTPLSVAKWHDELPLWACNNFIGVDSVVRYTRFCQKSGENPLTLPRQSATLQDKKPMRLPPSINGQYQHYLLPLRTELADYWETTCLGDRSEIEKLLPLITHVGKKTKFGYGAIANWQVSESETFNLSRPCPDPGGETFGSWTNPHWNSNLWTWLS